jgi:hypothetical protein
MPSNLNRAYLARTGRLTSSARRVIRALDAWTLDVTNPARHYNTSDRNARR